MRTKEQSNPLLTMVFRCYNAAKAIVFAKRYNLNNLYIRTKKNVVNLHYWHSGSEMGDNVKNNLGDDLSRIIVEGVLAKKGLSLDKRVSKTKHLYAVGSIISMGYQNATIWGSGFLVDLSLIRRLFHHFPLRKLDVRAVRGPYSRKLLLKLGYKCPEVYGDPGMLLPLFYSPTVCEKKRDYIIIPHFSKDVAYRAKYGDDVIVSMITDDYKSVIDSMVSARKVISGSLHGIILAEAYGVPAVFLHDRKGDRDFKYNDYYASTGRDIYKSADTVEQAIEMEPMELPENLKMLQEGLLKAFPYDLWN